MSNFSGQYFLLWSQSRNSFHIEPIEHTLSMNSRLYRDGSTVNDDFIPILIGSQDEIKTAALLAMQSTLASRKNLHKM